MEALGLNSKDIIHCTVKSGYVPEVEFCLPYKKPKMCPWGSRIKLKKLGLKRCTSKIPSKFSFPSMKEMWERIMQIFMPQVETTTEVKTTSDVTEIDTTDPITEEPITSPPSTDPPTEEPITTSPSTESPDYMLNPYVVPEKSIKQDEDSLMFKIPVKILKEYMPNPETTPKPDPGPGTDPEEHEHTLEISNAIFKVNNDLVKDLPYATMINFTVTVDKEMGPAVPMLKVEIIEPNIAALEMELVEKSKSNKPKKIPRVSGRKQMNFPWDNNNKKHTVDIPAELELKVRLKLPCLKKAKSFNDICNCQELFDESSTDSSKLKCDFKTPDLEPVENDDDFGAKYGLEYDMHDIAHIPSYKKSWIRFDMDCMHNVMDIYDLCKCQTEDSKPNCMLDPPKKDVIKIYLKNDNLRFQMVKTKTWDYNLSPNKYQSEDPLEKIHGILLHENEYNETTSEDGRKIIKTFYVKGEDESNAKLFAKASSSSSSSWDNKLLLIENIYVKNAKNKPRGVQPFHYEELDVPIKDFGNTEVTSIPDFKIYQQLADLKKNARIIRDYAITGNTNFTIPTTTPTTMTTTLMPSTSLTSMMPMNSSTETTPGDTTPGETTPGETTPEKTTPEVRSTTPQPNPETTPEPTPEPDTTARNVPCQTKDHHKCEFTTKTFTTFSIR